MTAIGTVALAAVTVGVIIVTIIITKQDRQRADGQLAKERDRHEQEIVGERMSADERLAKQLAHSDIQLSLERAAADKRLADEISAANERLQQERQAAQDREQWTEAYLVEVTEATDDTRGVGLTDHHRAGHAH